MKKRAKGMILWCLVLLLIGSMVGCDTPQEHPDGIKYRTASFVVPKESGITRQQLLTGNTLYYKAVQPSEATGIDIALLKKMNIENEDVQTLWQADPKDLTWINGFAEDTDGSVWYTELAYTDQMDEDNMPISKSQLCHVDTAGAKLAALDLSSVLTEGEAAFDLFATEDLLLLTAAQTQKSDAGILHNVWNVYGLDKQGEKQFQLAYTGERDLDGFVRLSDGQVAAIGDTLMPMDTETGAWGQPMPLTVSGYTDDTGTPARLTVYPSLAEEYLFLAQAGTDRLYGFNTASGQYEQLLDWAEQDVVWKSSFAVCMTEDHQLMAVSVGDGYGVRLTRITYE